MINELTHYSVPFFLIALVYRGYFVASYSGESISFKTYFLKVFGGNIKMIHYLLDPWMKNKKVPIAKKAILLNMLVYCFLIAYLLIPFFT